MPVETEIDLGIESAITFDEWIESAFGRLVMTGTAFAKAHSGETNGYIITDRSLVLLEKMPINQGTELQPGQFIAKGAAEGVEILHGGPFAIFVSQRGPLSSEIYKDHIERYLTDRWKRLLDLSHFEHEDIILNLEFQPDPRSIPYIKKAIDLKPKLEYLSYDDYGAYYKKCLWALRKINTPEAIQLIEECAESDIPELRDQALYRLKRMAEGG